MNTFDNWDDVRYFLALAHHGSLSSAARSLGVSHVTVSRRITALEEALGAQVFEKSPRGFRLTLLGEALLSPAVKVEDAMLHMERTAHLQDSEPRGVVRIALAGFGGILHGMPIASAMRDVYPGITLEFMESPNVVDLEREDADIALRISVEGILKGRPHLLATKVGKLDWAIFGASPLVETYPDVRSGNFEGAPLVVFSDEAPGKPEQSWVAQQPNAWIVARSNSAVGILGGVLSATGFGPCPIQLAERFGLVQLTPAITSMSLFVVMHPDVKNSARVRVVADFICSYFDQPMAEDFSSPSS